MREASARGEQGQFTKGVWGLKGAEGFEGGVGVDAKLDAAAGEHKEGVALVASREDGLLGAEGADLDHLGEGLDLGGFQALEEVAGLECGGDLWGVHGGGIPQRAGERLVR